MEGFMTRLRVAIAVAGLALAASCARTAVPAPPELEPGLSITALSPEVEAGGTLALSAFAVLPGGGIPEIEWTSEAGSVVRTAVANEADFIAPQAPGTVMVRATAVSGGESFQAEYPVTVLPAGALKKTALVVIEVDAATLEGVWVDAAHPKEKLSPPLKIKGTFRYDPATGEAFAGGSWPVFEMRDDGQKGDRAAGDGIWTIAMNFEKGDAKVYFAFDDNSTFRVEWESGLAWRLKMAWIDLDEFPDDTTNPAFVPDGDKTIRWTADMAAAAGLHGPAK